MPWNHLLSLYATITEHVHMSRDIDEEVQQIEWFNGFGRHVEDASFDTLSAFGEAEALLSRLSSFRTFLPRCAAA